MNYLRIILRLTRRSMLCLVLLYELIFIGGSAITFLLGGPGRTATWYRHVLETPLIGNCVGDTCTFPLAPWDLQRLGWGRFWIIQLLYIAFALVLVFIERRAWNQRVR